MQTVTTPAREYSRLYGASTQELILHWFKLFLGGRVYVTFTNCNHFCDKILNVDTVFKAFYKNKVSLR